MGTDYDVTVARLLLALLAGGLVGLERTYHGRPAGFRTHSLVCVASALLMQFTLLQAALMPLVPESVMRIDPTRMAQGIMTGIGFLGAGVILKEGLTIRGLTTAASIWLTASIGIVMGMGLYFAGVFSTVLAIGVLSVFRWLEERTPTLHFASLSVACKGPDRLTRDELNEVVRRHRIDFTRPSYHLEGEGRVYRYDMRVRTRDPDNFHALSEALASQDRVLEFSLEPTGD
jgi:putative Mg2+ transporter-C (MgtC) family protein